MSENLDLVRSIYADWERGDFFSNTDWAAPDFEFVIVEGTQQGNWTGSAAADGWRGFLGAWDRYSAEAEEFRDLNNGRVLVLVRADGRGKLSEVDVENRSANVFDIRDGRVTRLALYQDRDGALADLGLEE